MLQLNLNKIKELHRFLESSNIQSFESSEGPFALCVVKISECKFKIYFIDKYNLKVLYSYLIESDFIIEEVFCSFDVRDYYYVELHLYLDNLVSLSNKIYFDEFQVLNEKWMHEPFNHWDSTLKDKYISYTQDILNLYLREEFEGLNSNDLGYELQRLQNNYCIEFIS